MFNEYIRKILPIPIVMVENSQKDNYLYRITTYSSIINESGTENIIENIVNNCKRIKSISGWRSKPDNHFYKQAIIEFARR